jgi:predicted HD phosphohydrolase
MTSSPQTKALDRLFDILEADESKHGLQCAYELAMMRPDDVGLQLAGLLHDVAHGTESADGLSTEATHGDVGAAMVRPVFGERIAALVQLHVPAKRYLVTVNPAYASLLATDSIDSLALQGGNMSRDEVARFEETPHAMHAVVLRQADDQAKRPSRNVPGLDHWRVVAHAFSIPMPQKLAVDSHR